MMDANDFSERELLLEIARRQSRTNELLDQLRSLAWMVVGVSVVIAWKLT